jgi:hypothetical protein
MYTFLLKEKRSKDSKFSLWWLHNSSISVSQYPGFTSLGYLSTKFLKFLHYRLSNAAFCFSILSRVLPWACCCGVLWPLLLSSGLTEKGTEVPGTQVFLIFMCCTGALLSPAPIHAPRSEQWYILWLVASGLPMTRVCSLHCVVLCIFSWHF